ncbi:MAG: thiamine phosphate synthase [Bacteroidota bacterium]|nr:thiamine phosphate synthase [Bacteroidota bacterium]
MYSKLQYISQGATSNEHYENIASALEAGCDWIQLRFKDKKEMQESKLAERVKDLCVKHKAVFIVNDFVDIAKAVDADGIHLGLDDDSIAHARAILGKDKIIGGTANTLQHVIKRIEEKCDYVGLGPFRFTTTKEKLSPILGAEGYTTIVNELKAKSLSVPIYAIGGIETGDIETIMNTGVHGIAVSGLVTKNPNKKELVEQLNTLMHANA